VVAVALVRDEQLMPPRPQGMGRGFAMALVAHALLVVALALGVNWRSSEPVGIEAELWAAVPQAAAPPAAAPEPPKPAPTPVPPKPEPRVEPPPKPAQPDPQIAIEQEKKRKLEQQKREQEEKEKEKEKAAKDKADKLKAEKAEADKKKKEEAQQQARLDAQRKANLDRIMAQAGNGDTPGATAQQAAGPSATYAGRVKARVKPNITFTESVVGNPTAEVEVRCAPDGTILSNKLIKSSGVAAWDDAVLRALEKTQVLPRDTDGRVPSPMILSFRPNDF
jgi:colicin import membrane protein